MAYIANWVILYITYLPPLKQKQRQISNLPETCFHVQVVMQLVNSGTGFGVQIKCIKDKPGIYKYIILTVKS